MHERDKMTEETANKNKSPTIVVLGNKGVGKTTIIASICHYIKTQDQFLFRFDLDNKKGTGYLKKIWLEHLEKGLFPPENGTSPAVAIDIGIEPVKGNVKHTLTFKEASGEVMQRQAHSVPYSKRFIKYLNEADMFLLVVEAKTAGSDDLLITMIFETLLTQEKKVPIFLVVSKWDLVGEDYDSPNEFIKARTPETYKWLKHGKTTETKILKFSVGKVSPENMYGKSSSIEELNMVNSEKVFNAIFEYMIQPDDNGKKREALKQKLKSNLSTLSKDPENIDLLKEIKNIYREMGEEAEAKEVEQKLNSLIQKKEFESNLGKPIVLQQVEVQQLDFFGEFRWTFHPRVNVLLGRNGYGKSHLMRFLVALLQKNDEKTSEFFENSKTEPFARLTVERDDNEDTIFRNRIVFEESIGKVPVLAIPDMRFVDKSKTIVSTPEDDKEKDLSQQWAYHFLYQKPVEGLIQNFLYQLCITYLDKGKTFDLPIFQLIHNVVGKLSDHPFEFKTIEPTGPRFKIEVITEGSANPMPIQKASQGTLSVLAIFGLIYSYLKTVFPKVPEENLLSQPAIVFIDEIDAHLHPSWQQKIIGLLREHFPNIQFVVTAHSPLVVAGCREGEVAVLRKKENRFEVKLFQQDFIGREARELYENVFDIEEKDDSYLHYNALYPFREEVEKEIEKLEKEKAKKPLTKAKEKKLSQLYDDLYYSKKANDMYQKRLEYSNVLSENRKLKAKLKKLEKQQHAPG